MSRYRVEFFCNGSWLDAHHDFDDISATYATESEAQSDIDDYNEWERSEGAEETSLRVVEC